ncbi:helix-hairpin-helix domain-containing protein [Halovivax limisalsi]|uniref:helix-hairpin-helix domain-containing protein n=1 Tax=Halovivax limisalsi TaxID=1453760 RepID=UPI001FFD83A8|nr:helix-hairpin-helix domain-containing protein [Halovivax limisalsi]
MTELRTFLEALYESFSEAEVQAVEHGRARYLELVERGAIPPDGSVPVYHASDVSVSLDVGLEAEPTEDGVELYVTESDSDDETGLSLSVELFDLVDADDFPDLEYEEIVDGPFPGRPGGGDGLPESQSVDAVRGIGPQFSADLEAAGIESIADLVAHSPEQLAEVVSAEGAVVSADRTRDWIEQARGMITVLSGGAQPVEFVDDIGPTFGSRLREHGVETLSDLVERSPDELAELVSTGSRGVSTERAAEWLDEADSLLAELESAGESTDGTRPTDEPTRESNDTDETDTSGDDR